MTNRCEWFRVLYFLGALIVFASNLTAFILLKKAGPLLQDQLCYIDPACLHQLGAIQYRLHVLNMWQWAGLIMFLAGFLAYYWPLLKEVVEKEVNV